MNYPGGPAKRWEVLKLPEQLRGQYFAVVGNTTYSIEKHANLLEAVFDDGWRLEGFQTSLDRGGGLWYHFLLSKERA